MVNNKSGDLTDRLRELNLAMRDWMDAPDIFIRPSSNRHYQGIVDAFPGRSFGYDPRCYVLWIDRLHKKYKYWKSYVTCDDNKHFKFGPVIGFCVEGELYENRVINDFDAYFVIAKNK